MSPWALYGPFFFGADRQVAVVLWHYLATLIFLDSAPATITRPIGGSPSRTAHCLGVVHPAVSSTRPAGFSSRARHALTG